MNRDMLSRRLERRGYTVICAVDGGQGVELARAEAPDLILMDMGLPVLDGWEASRRLKADAATRAIPVIALTALARQMRHALRTSIAHIIGFSELLQEEAVDRGRVEVLADLVHLQAGGERL